MVLTHGLFTHSTLVGISRRLVVIEVWYQPSTDTKYWKRFNLKVCRLPAISQDTKDTIRKWLKLPMNLRFYGCAPSILTMNGRQTDDLHCDIFLVHCEQTVVFLVHIKKLHQTAFQEVIKCSTNPEIDATSKNTLHRSLPQKTLTVT